jgi:hypothetical protein
MYKTWDVNDFIVLRYIIVLILPCTVMKSKTSSCIQLVKMQSIIRKKDVCTNAYLVPPQCFRQLECAQSWICWHSFIWVNWVPQTSISLKNSPLLNVVDFQVNVKYVLMQWDQALLLLLFQFSKIPWCLLTRITLVTFLILSKSNS